MKALNDFITLLSGLTEKEQQKYILITMGAISILIGGMMYYFYNKTSATMATIKTLYTTIEKSETILEQNRMIEQEEERIEKVLMENKEFNIKSFFETFCRMYSITPEAGWDTTTIPVEGNDKFNEVILPATFKHQTMQTLVNILDALDKKEIIYLKDLTIKREEKKNTISFDITLATKKQRFFIEE